MTGLPGRQGQSSRGNRAVFSVLADGSRWPPASPRCAASPEQSMRQATPRAERHGAQLLGKVCKSARISAARRMIAAREVAVGRMIAAYRRGDSDATDYEIAWVTVDLRVKDETWART